MRSMLPLITLHAAPLTDLALALVNELGNVVQTNQLDVLERCESAALISRGAA